MLESIYNYQKLSDRIATSGQPSEAEIGFIAETGYEVVINLAMPTSDNALENERELVESQGMIYIHMPVVWENPTQADLNQFIKIMSQYEAYRVFVHCAANMRVSVFVALFRIIKLGWKQNEAFEAMREIWEPDKIWRDFIAQALNE